MTFLGRVMAIFPAVALVFDVGAFFGVVLRPSLITAALLPFAIYGFPLLTFRLISIFRPLKTGTTKLDAPVYSAWWGAHQAQLLYEALPMLEAPLRILPGAYRAWLRAWGSRIGRGVYFTPTFRPLDRGLLVIGDGVILGHDVECSAHIISSIKGSVVLFVDWVTIEDGAFVGSGVRLGPSVVVGKGALVGIEAKLGPGARVEPGGIVAPCAVVRGVGWGKGKRTEDVDAKSAGVA